MRTLYHWPLCGSGRYVRLLLAEKKLEFEAVVEPYWKKREEFCEINPTAKVPALVELNQAVFTDGQVICEYLEEAYPGPHSYLGDTPAARAQTRSLCALFASDFYQEVMHKVVFEKTLKRHFGLGYLDSQVMREGLKKFGDYLEYFSWLIGRRHWLAGEDYSLADMAGAAYISCLDYLGHVPWDTYPDVKEWYARIKSRPSMRPLLEDRIPGITPAYYYTDPDF
jgi:glutathione S-transferase